MQRVSFVLYVATMREFMAKQTSEQLISISYALQVDIATYYRHHAEIGKYLRCFLAFANYHISCANFSVKLIKTYTHTNVVTSFACYVHSCSKFIFCTNIFALFTYSCKLAPALYL